jgi:hypothetical protein
MLLLKCNASVELYVCRANSLVSKSDSPVEPNPKLFIDVASCDTSSDFWP